MAKGQLARIHYDSALRPQRSRLAHPNVSRRVYYGKTEVTLERVKLPKWEIALQNVAPYLPIVLVLYSLYRVNALERGLKITC